MDSILSLSPNAQQSLSNDVPFGQWNLYSDKQFNLICFVLRACQVKLGENAPKKTLYLYANHPEPPIQPKGGGSMGIANGVPVQ